MLTAAALGFVNHLLDGEAWARARLASFAGQCVHVSCGPLTAQVEITAQGTLRQATDDTEAAVHIVLPADTPWRLMSDRSTVLAAARINGSAQLADCLAFIIRHLRWDVEDDLARIIGDVPARRLVLGGQALWDWQAKASKNLGRNLAEYLTEESPLIVGRAEADAFQHEVDAVARAVDRLALRLDALAGQSAP